MWFFVSVCCLHYSHYLPENLQFCNKKPELNSFNVNNKIVSSAIGLRQDTYTFDVNIIPLNSSINY